VHDVHYDLICSASAPALIVDAEVLHRGAATPCYTPTTGTKQTETAGDNWVSTCSVELCSPTGFEAWNSPEGTGGTVAPTPTKRRRIGTLKSMDQVDDVAFADGQKEFSSWEMIPIACCFPINDE
jgi:hypothetical protein